MQTEPQLKLLPAKQLHRLAQFLLDNGYTETGKRHLWERALPPVGPRTKGLLLDLVGPPTLSTLVRLFELGIPVKESEVKRNLPAWALEVCLSSGLLHKADGSLSSGFQINSVQGKLLLCDHFHATPTAENSVVGRSGVADRLRYGIPRTPCSRALDVCVGGGIQSLFLADHCEHVVGIDLNPRALEIAHFNMRLNGIENVELRQGDRLAPVAGMTFDLIVCNPPFYISPSRRTLYSDNQMELDEFCRCVVREAAGHLTETGELHALAEWVEIEGQTPQERLTAWFNGLGCDVWVMREYQNDIPNYIRKRLIENPPSDRRVVAEWMQFFEDRKVTKIHGGAIVLRRREGKTWTFFDEFDRRVNAGGGEYVKDGIAIRDFLTAHESNDSLLHERFIVSPYARIEEHFKPDGREWSTDFVRIRLTGPVEVSAKTTNSMVRVLKRLDGERTLEQAIRVGCGLKDDAPITHLDQYLDTTRPLLRRGFILPKRSDSNDATNRPGK